MQPSLISCCPPVLQTIYLTCDIQILDRLGGGQLMKLFHVHRIGLRQIRWDIIIGIEHILRIIGLFLGVFITSIMRLLTDMELRIIGTPWKNNRQKG